MYKVYPDGTHKHVGFERYNLSSFADSEGNNAKPRRRTEKVGERFTVVSKRTNWWRHRTGWDFMLRFIEPSWRAVLFVFLADFVLLMVLCISDQAERYAAIAEQSETIEDWHYLGDIANQWQAVFALVFGVVMAVFTYMLYRISVAQMAMLDRANKTADDALKASLEATKQTKRSVDLLFEIERGRIELDAMDLMRPPDHEVAAIVLRYRNAGNTTATSIRRGMNTQFLGPDNVILDVPVASAFAHGIERMPLPPGELYGFNAPRSIAPELFKPEVVALIPLVLSGELRLFAQGFIRYEVITGVVFWNWYTMQYRPDTGNFAPDPTCAFNGHGREDQGHRPVVSGGTL